MNRKIRSCLVSVLILCASLLYCYYSSHIEVSIEKRAQVEIVEVEDEQVLLSKNGELVLARLALLKPKEGKGREILERFHELKDQSLEANFFTLNAPCGKNMPLFSVVLKENGKETSLNEELIKEELFELDSCLLKTSDFIKGREARKLMKNLSKIKPENESLKRIQEQASLADNTYTNNASLMAILVIAILIIWYFFISFITD